MMEVIHINDGRIGITAHICYHLTINILICVHVMKRKETVRFVTGNAFARFSLDQIKSVNVHDKSQLIVDKCCNSHK